MTMSKSEDVDFCSTPRGEAAPQDPTTSFVSQTPTLESPIESEESEADIIERNVRMRDTTEFYQLSSDIQPTTLLSSPIMHTRETPKIASYFDGVSSSNQFLPQLPNFQDVTIEPSAPPLPPNSPQPEQTIKSDLNEDQVPLFDVNTFRTMSPKDSKIGSHLGQRPTQISPSLSPPAQVSDTTHSSQSQESISPILSPETSLNLQTSIHWYYSNPDGSWNPFSFCDSTKIEDAFIKLSETSSSGRQIYEIIIFIEFIQYL